MNNMKNVNLVWSEKISPILHTKFSDAFCWEILYYDYILYERDEIYMIYKIWYEICVVYLEMKS